MVEEIENSYCPTNQNDWRNWLHVNHACKDFIWLILHKKSSPTPNLSWSQAVDEALCYGWIDSTKKTLDQHRYIQYFCPRKPNSTWSKVNKDKLLVLEEKNRIQPAGYESIRKAKANGSWTLLDSVEALIVPGELKEALQKTQGGWAYFDGLSKSQKKGLLWWIATAKREDTRTRRILQIQEAAENNELPKAFKVF